MENFHNVCECKTVLYFGWWFTLQFRWPGDLDHCSFLYARDPRCLDTHHDHTVHVARWSWPLIFWHCFTFRQTQNYTKQQRQSKTVRDFHYYNTIVFDFTVKLGYNNELGTAIFAFKKRVILWIKVTNGTWKYVHYNLVFAITECVITKFHCIYIIKM